MGEADLEDIVVYTFEKARRRKTAQRIYADIRKKCDLYASQPLLGQLLPELGQSYRGFVYKRWLIIYRPRDYGIEVFAVLDSAREFAAFFRQRMGIGE